MAEVRRLKQLEEESKRLKCMVADLRLDQAYQVGVRRSCAVLQFGRTSYYYRSTDIDDFALRKRIRESRYQGQMAIRASSFSCATTAGQ